MKNRGYIKEHEVEEEEQGFPPRPHSFGSGGAVWPFKEMSNLRNQKYDPKHTFCTSLDWTTGKPTAPCPHKSKKKTCLFAHRWSDLKRPTDYRTYETEEAIITVRSWHHQTSHDMPLTRIFPTKLTYYQLHIEKRQQLEGVVCYNFLFHGKCPYWANCTFVHPSLEDFRRELQTQFCPTRPSTACQFHPICPYAHSPMELLIPREFAVKDELTTSEVTIKVYYDKVEEDIPLCYVAPTEARNQELEQGVTRLPLCQDICDLWRYCDKIHLVKQFWDDFPTTQLPLHPTLRYAKGVIGSTPFQPSSDSVPSSSSNLGLSFGEQTNSSLFFTASPLFASSAMPTTAATAPSPLAPIGSKPHSGSPTQPFSASNKPSLRYSKSDPFVAKGGIGDEAVHFPHTASSGYGSPLLFGTASPPNLLSSSSSSSSSSSNNIIFSPSNLLTSNTIPYSKKSESFGLPFFQTLSSGSITPPSSSSSPGSSPPTEPKKEQANSHTAPKGNNDSFFSFHLNPKDETVPARPFFSDGSALDISHFSQEFQQNVQLGTASGPSGSALSPFSSPAANIRPFLETPPVSNKTVYKERRDCHREFELKPRWTSSSLRFRQQIQQMVDHCLYKVIGERYHSCMNCENLSVASGQTRILYHPSLKISEGASSDVYIGLKEDDGMEVAVKILREVEDELNDQLYSSESSYSREHSHSDRHFKSEVEKLKTRNIIPGMVRYHMSLVAQDPHPSNDTILSSRRCFVFELMECSLDELVQNWKARKLMNGVLFNHTCQYIIGSLLLSLNDLTKTSSTEHYYAINRTDLKPANIMFDKFHQVKILDFSTGKELNMPKEKYSSYIVSSSVLYAPPEALDFPRFSHPTSDLYSLGLLTYYLFTGKEDWGTSGSQACVPSSIVLQGIPRNLGFREHKYAHIDHFIKILVAKDPQNRAYWQRRKGKCHQVLLQHPFFWHSRKCNNFLVNLGNLFHSRIPEMRQIQERIERILAKMSVNYWWEPIEQNVPKLWNAKKHSVKEEVLNDPLGLLRFIRNCYIHAEDGEVDQLFQTKPFFLELFPSLVIECWEVCQGSDALFQHPLLQPSLASTFQPNINLPFEDISWL